LETQSSSALQRTVRHPLSRCSSPGIHAQSTERGYCGTENQGTTAKGHRPARQKSNKITKHKDKPTSTSRRARYTPADDAKILRLKGRGLSWIEIAEQFTGRSAGAIEVRYYTKLKREEEWEVEAICRHRTRDDGDLEVLVRWTGGEETWEPYENMAETEALDVYERLHGPVTVDTLDAAFV
jgi:broad specificity phosphatase PhoE